LVDWLIAVALGGVVLTLVWSSLGPSSLFFDDAWQALVVKAHSFREVMLVSLTAPGYTLLLRGWFELVGFSELGAQLPSVFFAVLLPGAAYLIARRRGLNRLAALLGGALLLSSPVLLTYATHVKQFSLNAFLGLVLVSYAWLIIDEGGTARRWVLLLVLASCATIMSGAVSPVAVGVLLAAAVADTVRGPRHRGWSLAALGGYALFGAAWWLLYLHHAVNPSLVDIWRDFYIGHDGPLTFLRDVTVALVRLADGFTSVPVWISCPALFLATLVGARRRWATTLLLLCPVTIAVAVAALRLGPLGAGRTDTQLFPAMALLIAYGANDLVKTRTVQIELAVAVGLISLLPVLVPVAVPYPQEDVRPLVELINASGHGNPVVVHGWTYWAFALYSDRAITFVESTDPTGFDVSYADPNVLQLERFGTEAEFERKLEDLDDADPVWFVASHFRPDWPDDYAMTLAAFRSIGYRIGQRWDRPGALLIRWDRRGG
jgi:hypothetical protein